jgi:predicted aspartyl protease
MLISDEINITLIGVTALELLRPEVGPGNG